MPRSLPGRPWTNVPNGAAGDHLLGSLTGQLQLATYLAVFLGFSGASIGGLWLTQRNQAISRDTELRANARSLEKHLLADRLLEKPATESATARQRRKQVTATNFASLVAELSKVDGGWAQVGFDPVGRRCVLG